MQALPIIPNGSINTVLQIEGNNRPGIILHQASGYFYIKSSHLPMQPDVVPTTEDEFENARIDIVSQSIDNSKLLSWCMSTYIIGITDGSEQCSTLVKPFDSPCTAIEYMRHVLGCAPPMQWKHFKHECTIGQMVATMHQLGTPAYLIDDGLLYQCQAVGDGLVKWEELS